MRVLVPMEKPQRLNLKDNMIIYGASGHGKVIKFIATSIGVTVRGFADDNYNENTYLGVPLQTIKSTDKIIVGIGDNAIRKKIAQQFMSQWHEAIIHKTAIVSLDKKIGAGTVVMAGAIINNTISIGIHCIINTGSIVEHDCIVKDYVHISPNTTLSGGVIINEGTHVGAGAVIIPGITIGKWVIIGAGAVVIRDVPDYAVVVGNPGRIIKQNQR